MAPENPERSGRPRTDSPSSEVAPVPEQGTGPEELPQQPEPFELLEPANTETPPEQQPPNRTDLAEAISTGLIEPAGMSGESEEIDEAPINAETEVETEVPNTAPVENPDTPIENRAQYEELAWSEFKAFDSHMSDLLDKNDEEMRAAENKWEKDRQTLSGRDLLRAEYEYWQATEEYWNLYATSTDRSRHDTTIRHLGHPLPIYSKTRKDIRKYYDEDVAKLAKNRAYKRDMNELDRREKDRLKAARESLRRKLVINRLLARPA